MARTDDAKGQSVPGFEGEVAGMGLTDVLQVNARNRFSGCVRIQNGASLGVVFFRDGAIVHAEQGAKIGEEAFIDILQWQQGRLSVELNVVAARRTIEKGCEHLILDSHRILDERRAGRERARPAPPPLPAGGPDPGSVVELVRSIPGVDEAVVITGQGQSLGDQGYASELLAGQVAYLAMLGAEFGALFQGGEVRSASVEGTDRHMLLYASKSHHTLGVFARPDVQVGAVDAAVRAALTKVR
jgi:predicted regulator of Ras-like GTPase activity (Roadblock/LC7/MglB family)